MLRAMTPRWQLLTNRHTIGRATHVKTTCRCQATDRTETKPHGDVGGCSLQQTGHVYHVRFFTASDTLDLRSRILVHVLKTRDATSFDTVVFISPNSCLVFLATPAHISRTRRQRCVPNLTTAYPSLHPRSAISCTVPHRSHSVGYATVLFRKNTELTELSKADCGQVEGVTVVLS